MSQLCVHEIANGPHRQKALDKPYAVLVLCWHCNGSVVTNKKRWPEPRQLARLWMSRPGDFDLAAFCNLINANAPNRVTAEEVREHLESDGGSEMADRHLTVSEVAERLSCSRNAVESWIASGELSAIDVSPSGGVRRAWRIEEGELFDFCQERRNWVPVAKASQSPGGDRQLLKDS